MLMGIVLLTVAGTLRANEPEEQPATDSAERSFRVAAALYQRGEWSLAAAEFESLATQYPDHPRSTPALIYRAECVTQLRQYALALDLLAETLSEDCPEPYRQRAMLRQVELSRLDGREADAARFLKLYTAAYPDDASTTVLIERAHAALAESQPDAALESLAQLASADKKRFGAADVQLLQARSLRRAGRTDEARPILNRLSASPDKSIAAQARYESVLLASESAGSGFDDLLDDLNDNLTADDPLVVHVRVLQARRALAAGDAPLAIELLDSAVASTADAPLAWRHLLGLALYEAGRETEAVDTLLRVVDESEQDVELQTKAQLALARSLVELAEYGAAAEQLAALEHHASTQPGLVAVMRVRVQYALGNTSTAEEMGQAALASIADDATKHDLAIRLGDLAFEACDYATAASWYAVSRSTWRKHKDGQAIAVRHLWSLWQAKDTDAIGAAAQRIATLWPESDAAQEALLIRGYAAAERGDTRTAGIIYEQLAASKDPSLRIEALVRAGRIAQRTGQPEAAADYYARALDEWTDDDLSRSLSLARCDLLLALGLLEYKLDRADAARQTLSELVDREPDSARSVDAWFALAELSAAEKDHTLTAIYSDRVLDHPHASPAQLARSMELFGRSAGQLGRWEDVVAEASALVESAESGPQVEQAEFWLAESASQADDTHSAICGFTSLAAKSSDDAMVVRSQLRAAQCLFSQGKTSEARQLADVLLRKLPEQTIAMADWVEAAYLAGRCHAKLGEFSAARSRFTDAVAKGRSFANAEVQETAAKSQWMIGETYFHQQRFLHACRAYQLVVAGWPNSSWRSASLLQAAKCQARLGEHESAERLYEQLLQETPQGEYAAEARTQLERLKTAANDSPDRY